MQVIWKETLNPFDPKILIPKDAKILCCHEQYDAICVWFLCEPSGEEEFRRFEVIGTGHQHDEIKGNYIGTAHLHGGTLVLHVFELPK